MIGKTQNIFNKKKLRLQFRPQALGQKNYRTVPSGILRKIQSLQQDDFIVACMKKVRSSEIAAHKYKHIGLTLNGDVPVFPEQQIPHPRTGRYCAFNAKGVEIILKHLPKVLQTFSFEAPNFGDWSNGSHPVEWDREVYQREFFPPKQLALRIELLGEEIKDEKFFLFKFTIVEVLNRKKQPFIGGKTIKNDLFFNLNLLQECVGAADVFSSNATRDDYLRSLYVDWEILPLGEREGTIERIISGVKTPTPELRKKIAQRYNLLLSLNPQAFISGTSGLQRYFGAKFADDFVVFEHLEYGNAIYVMFEQWETLSKLTRPQLLKGDRSGFERIVHRKGWEAKLKELLTQKRLRLAA